MQAETASVLLVILMSLGAASLADEPKQIQFQDSIERMAELRSAITSYDVTITATVDFKKESDLTTSGEVYVYEKIPTAFTMDLALDKDAKLFLVARRDEYLEKKTGKKIVEGWELYANSESWQLSRNRGQATGFITNSNRVRLNRPQFFDPLGLGLAFPGEFRRGDAVEKIIENLQGWGNSHAAKRLDDGRLKYSGADHYLIVDTERGFWPIEMELRGANEVSMYTAIQLTQVDGQWLPQAAEVQLPLEKTEMKFEWHSVNKPLPNERFTFQEIAKRYQFPIEDGRVNGR